MTQEKHIELFPGSLSDLERITGKQYEPMKKSGELVEVNALIILTSHYGDLYSALRMAARTAGADALVHVTNSQIDIMHSVSKGYAVKETTCRTLTSKEQEV